MTAMREELKKINGFRYRFIATFERYGSKPAYRGSPIETLLFENVRDKYGKQYCDHIWFTTNKMFKRLALEPGDEISFDARVKAYIKGYRGSREDDEEFESKPISKDYKLSHPNNIIKHIIKVNDKGQLALF